MWRRFGVGRDPPAIGSPMMFETTMDNAYLETIPEVESIISRRSSVRTTALPELPFRAVEPMQVPRRRAEQDTTSSIYSESSFEIPHNQQMETVHENTSVSEISSLSTPRSSIDHRDSNPIVSPIESHFPSDERLPKPDVPPRSLLPRRVPVGGADRKEGSMPPTERNPSASTVELSQPVTKWDELSGEPSENGQPASVRPGAQPLELQYPQLKERTKQILANLREKDATKKHTWGRPPPPVEASVLPVEREPWKGQSGREALVEPARDNPSARSGPLHIPQRNISRQNPVRSGSRSPTPTEVTQPPTMRSVASQESIKPVVPLKLGTISPRLRSPVGAEHSQSLQDALPSPTAPLATSIYASVTVPVVSEDMVESPTNHNDDPLTPTTPTLHSLPQHQPGTGLHEEIEVVDEDHNQPGSRFSWTTYATTVNDSPPRSQGRQQESPVPSIPDIPSSFKLRKRPVPSQTYPMSYANYNANHSTASIVSRKPVARAASAMTAASLSKDLPQCPPEMEALDKISTLEARMDDLARRKRNNNKIIKEITENMRRNSIAYDNKKRREVEKMITLLSLELDEVTQEEHETGLILHRAQRKRDRDDNYENPTGLWIKRVTS